MPVILFIQDREGDHNYEVTWPNLSGAQRVLESIKNAGGWWVDTAADDEPACSVFVPWHQAVYASIEETIENGEDTDIGENNA